MSHVVLRRSRFVHLIDLGPTRVLAVHAITQTRLTVTHPVAQLIRFFDQPNSLEIVLPQLASELELDSATIRTCAAMLLDRGILTDRTPEEETAETVRQLGRHHGRDPTALLDQYRRAHMEGAHPVLVSRSPARAR